MRTPTPPSRGIRQFLKTHTYHSGQNLFFRSRRAFRLLATPRGIGPPENFSEYEKVFVYVTPWWWVASFFRTSTAFSAVVVPKTFGRFGNQTLQLAHAITIAHLFHAKTVLCPGNGILPRHQGPLPDGTSLNTTTTAIGKAGVGSILRGLLTSSQEAHLVGNFFYTTALENGSVTPEERTISYDLIKKAIGSQHTVAPLPPEHLVIHLRGGDAFGPHAHNEYGQPPLAFYRLILSEGEWSKVTIVTADDIHPLLPQIINDVKERGVPCSIQSGTVDEDTKFLMSATTLVSSRSTFIPAIAAFSDNARTIYVFGDDDRFPTHVTVKRVTDTVGTYWNSTCVYNWTDEPWQRELMVNYPLGNLAVSDT